MDFRTKRLLVSLLFLLLLAALAPAPGRAEPHKEPAAKTVKARTSPGDAVAKVGGHVITRAELDRFMAAQTSQKRLPQAGTPE